MGKNRCAGSLQLNGQKNAEMDHLNMKLEFDKNGTAVPGAHFSIKKIKSLITFSMVVFQKNGNIKRDSA